MYCSAHITDVLPQPSISTPMIASRPISCRVGHIFSLKIALSASMIGPAIKYRALARTNGGSTSTP